MYNNYIIPHFTKKVNIMDMVKPIKPPFYTTISSSQILN